MGPFRRHLSFLAVGLIFLVAACSEEGLPVGTNAQAAAADAPVITGVDQKDLGNGFVGLTAKATDPKNRPLTFNWTVDNGQLSQAAGRAVTWKVPTQAGSYVATLVVKNDTGQSATGTQRFTVSQTGQVQAQGNLEVTSAGTGGTIVNGQFVIPSPLGSVQPNPPIVGGNPAAPAPSAALPTPPLSQPVATPAPGSTPVPTAGPMQPIVTPTPTVPPLQLPPSPFPSPSPATPEPEVPQIPPTRWIQYNTAKIPLAANWTSLHFLSPTKGYIAGSSGAVLYYEKTGTDEPALVTRNGGVPSTEIKAIRFADENNGFLGALSGKVMRTTNGGVSWEDISPELTTAVSDVTSVIVTNKQIVTISDALGRVYRNEGANATDAATVKAGWVQQPTKPDDRPADVTSQIAAGTGFASDPTLFYFVGGEGIYRLDTDNPDPTKIWRRMYQYKRAEGLDLGDGFGTAIKAASNSEVWIGTTGGTLIRLQNANTDTPTALRLKADAYDNREANGNGVFLPRVSGIGSLAVLDPNNGFVSHSGGVYDTNDGTKEWRLGPNMPSTTFSAMQIDFVVENNKTTFRGFGVSTSGAIWQYKSGT